MVVRLVRQLKASTADHRHVQKRTTHHDCAFLETHELDE